jgi:hypothetical protein
MLQANQRRTRRPVATNVVDDARTGSIKVKCTPFPAPLHVPHRRGCVTCAHTIVNNLFEKLA